jgi:hypothetical protein
MMQPLAPVFAAEQQQQQAAHRQQPDVDHDAIDAGTLALSEAIRIGIKGRCSADASRRFDPRAMTCRQDVPGNAAVGAEHLQLL